MINFFRQLKRRIVWVHKGFRERGLNPLKPLVIFDVGANNGSNFLEAAKLLPWIKIYAFEPTPFLVKEIRSQISGIKNFILVPKAVGEIPGKTMFNVAGLGDWGCSSLLEFSDNLKETWPGRDDLRVTDRIAVEVITLEDYVISEGIGVIDFLHIDTQGTDLSVLKSLGSAIKRVRAGAVEVPHSQHVKLYKGQHSREEMINFLEKNHFTIWKESSQQNEDNLFFRIQRS